MKLVKLGLQLHDLGARRNADININNININIGDPTDTDDDDDDVVVNEWIPDVRERIACMMVQPAVTSSQITSQGRDG